MKNKYLVLLYLLSPSVFASTPKLSDVLESTRNHYPAIIQARNNVQAAEATLRNSNGAYDMKLKGDNFWVTTGYYKRHLNEIKVVKPLPVMGSSLYTSYGKAFPNFFPPQFSTMSTNSGGQAMVGGEMSLIKNSFLDAPRAQIKTSEFNVGQAKQDLEWSKLQLSKDAAILYWSWLAHSRIYYIYANLLDMAVKRDEILAQRVHKGDTSEIVRKENQQYMARRKAELAQTQIDVTKSALDLSLYYRDQNGNVVVPTIVSNDELTQNLSDEEIKVKNEMTGMVQDGLVTKMVDQRPDFQHLKLEIDKNEVEYRMGVNELLPALNVGADFTRYMGNEDPTNAAHIVQLNLKFEIPLEWELGEGRKQAAGANRRVLSSKLNYMKDNISNELKKYEEVLKLAKEKVDSTRNEVKFARDLLEAEYIRFKNGNSNLFVVNLREENLAGAQANETHAITELLQIFSEFKAATMQL
jgi:outer membrane protein TolC